MRKLADLLPFLCPAGNGVYTVHTAAALRDRLHQGMYGGQTGKYAYSIWESELENADVKSVSHYVIGIASDCGGGILRGANWGPLFLRKAFYSTYKHPHVFDVGDVRVIPQLLLDEYVSESILSSAREFLYGDANKPLPVSPLSITARVCDTLHAISPTVPIIALGGDHSVSYPLVSRYLKAIEREGKRCAVIHFDAHTDLLEQRMGVPVSFGSWVYHILADLHQPQDLIQIGLRSSAHDKAYWEDRYGIQQHWMSSIREAGVTACIQSIRAYLRAQQIDTLYITFDIDCLDAKIAGATGTPEPDGLLLSEAVRIIKALRKVCPIGGADLVEVAPFLGLSERVSKATVRSGAAVMAALMGTTDF